MRGVDPARDRSSSARSTWTGLLLMSVSYCQISCAPRHALPARTYLAPQTPQPSTRDGIPSLPTARAACRCRPANTVRGAENASNLNLLAYSSEPHNAGHRAGDLAVAG